tara:strand:- start:6648 stop:9140 length:2493 start_codon:yes stop_codon:yes gene_type:complete
MKKDFIARCMADSKSTKDFPDRDQRYAFCMNTFEDSDYTATIETVEALQYGRPGKRDPRKTPAKPSERRKGSKKNKPGSAKKPNKSIKMSKGTESRIRKLMTEHNKKVAAKGKGSKASMGALKSVFRRGAGAFSRSHAPGMGRTGWGIARVKAFLYLLRNGRPSNPNYKQDNDLLPKSHPRSKKAGTAEEESFTYDFPEYEDWGIEAPVVELEAAEYQGRKVTLNKPFRTRGAAKKFAVYVRNESGKVVIVRFGDPNMEIKRDDPERRRNFRSRHNCDNPGPKTKARYWSCKMWERGKSVTQYTSGENMEEEYYEEFYEEFYEDEESVEAAEPKPKSTETHQEYMDRCTAMGYTKDECMKAHEGHKFKDQDEAHDEKDHAEAGEGGCGCGCDGEPVEAKEVGKDRYDNPREAGGRAQELGCKGIHRDGDNFMPCESHEEYMKMVEKEAAYDKDKDKEASYHMDSCPPGKEMKDGKCVRVAVTCEVEVEEIETRIEASTGKTIMRISGVAFTNGVNKNKWGIRPALAKRLAKEMVGADVTLNHPKAEMGRFTRNMDGGTNEAVVGEVTEASYHDRKGGYVVRYVAEVVRPELFSALESGLYLRSDYGVSIGGTGIPSEVIEAEEAGGRPTMWFADDFDFDHLAIVYRPAYREANIEKVERVEASTTLKYQTDSSDIQPKVSKMTDEEINMASELEALKAELVLREARIAEFEAAEEARAEEDRLSLVNKASELGLKGHEDFSSETLNTMIASWEASRPVVEEPKVEMAPAVPASEPVAASEAAEPVVANYLNGELVKTPETLYARAYNAWAKAYNQVMVGETRAKLYEQLE